MIEVAARAAREPRVAGDSVPRYELDRWRSEFGVVAGITGRDGDFDLRLGTRGGAGMVQERWARLQRAAGPGFRAVAVSRQVHGTAVAIYETASAGLLVGQGVDGHVTGQRGLLLAVTVADCVPVYLAHPASGTVGLLHAGWRGTAAGILEAGISKLCEAARGVPRDLIIHYGVGICGVCYEVGPEVWEALTGRRPAGRSPIDLRALLAARAAAVGVRHMTVSEWCPACEPERFFSHRRSAGQAGRMVAYVGIPMA